MEIFLTFSEGFGLFEVHFLIKNFLINKKTRIKLASDLAFLNHSQESLRLNKSGYYQIKSLMEIHSLILILGLYLNSAFQSQINITGSYKDV